MTKKEEKELFKGLKSLPEALWEDLAAKNPVSVMQQALVTHERDQGYKLPFLGFDYLIDPLKRTITCDETAPKPGFQSGLVMLSYLNNASFSGLGEEVITEQQLKGGSFFFKGPHALSKDDILLAFGNDSLGFLREGLAQGASQLPGQGDAAIRILALPKVLINYILYEADDEFPARLVIAFSSNTDQHLPLDAVFALINVWTRRLAGKHAKTNFPDQGER